METEILGDVKTILNTVVSNDCYLGSVFWDMRSGLGFQDVGSATDKRLQIKGECSARKPYICCTWA